MKNMIAEVKSEYRNGEFTISYFLSWGAVIIIAACLLYTRF